MGCCGSKAEEPDHDNTTVHHERHVKVDSGSAAHREHPVESDKESVAEAETISSGHQLKSEVKTAAAKFGAGHIVRHTGLDEETAHSLAEAGLTQLSHISKGAYSKQKHMSACRKENKSNSNLSTQRRPASTKGAATGRVTKPKATRGQGR